MTDEIESLIKTLRDQDANARWGAVLTLGDIGTAEAVEPLIKALVDSSRYVRRVAAEALARTGAASVEPLCDVVGNAHRHNRMHIAHILGKIGDERAAEPLCNLLSDSEDYVREAAAEALGMIGDRDVLPRKILLSSEMTVQARAAALAALHSKNAQYFSCGLYYMYRTPDALNYCRKMAGDVDPEVREAAQGMLRYLEGHTLLRSSQNDGSTDQRELLRGALTQDEAESGDELLRSHDHTSSTVTNPLSTN